jgi:hypothetical protein
MENICKQNVTITHPINSYYVVVQKTIELELIKIASIFVGYVS